MISLRKLNVSLDKRKEELSLLHHQKKDKTRVHAFNCYRVNNAHAKFYLISWSLLVGGWTGCGFEPMMFVFKGKCPRTIKVREGANWGLIVS